MHRGLDAVLGVGLGLHSLEDVSTLIGVLETGAIAIGNVDDAGRAVAGAAEAGGVIGARFGRDGEVVAALPFEIWRRGVDDLLKPRTLELASLGGCGTLL